MPITTITKATCDFCNTEIDTDTKYVDAMVYGATFHFACWENNKGSTVAKALGLDDIHFVVNNQRWDRVY